MKLVKNERKAADYKQLALNFDKKCFSWNQFAGDADFEAGHSYAAELIPSELVVDRIPFRLENKELLNGMKCEGDTLSLPSGNTYNRLYILAASATSEKSLKCAFRIGKNVQEIKVPSYTGFIGQWEHTGHTEGFMTEAQVAYAGTHRHSAAGDHPYEFTYMFKFAIDIPAKATEIILPDNPEVVIFAATLAKEDYQETVPASVLFRTSNKYERTDSYEEEAKNKENILKPEQIIAWSGFVNENERPELMVDGKEDTKWCDVSGIPSYVDFDLGTETEIGSWKMVNAASENTSFVTCSCLLQARNSVDEEWHTIDSYTGNKKNIVNKSLEKIEKVRYLRLLVVQPVQAANSKGARVYEFAVYR